MNKSASFTIATLMQEGVKILKDKNISSSALDSRVLLAHVTSYNTEDLLLKRNMPLSPMIVAKFFTLIKRRQGHEPIAYIVGKKEFYGIDFKVDKNVLVPRPESETLIDLAQFYFKSRDKIFILDLGTGSGCLLLTLLSRLPRSTGVGIDISTEALRCAKKNADRLNLNQKVHFIKSSWSYLKLKNKFDLIISNPPYIKSKDISFLQKDVKNYEPRIALDGGKNGLDCYKKIFLAVQNLLKKNGICIFEIGAGQFNAISKLASNYNFKIHKFKKDLSKKIRAVSFMHYDSL